MISLRINYVLLYISKVGNFNTYPTKMIVAEEKNFVFI